MGERVLDRATIQGVDCVLVYFHALEDSRNLKMCCQVCPAYTDVRHCKELPGKDKYISDETHGFKNLPCNKYGSDETHVWLPVSEFARLRMTNGIDLKWAFHGYDQKEDDDDL